jgi:WD40 repeat protein
VAEKVAEFSVVPKDSFFVGEIEFNPGGSELLASPLVAQDDVHVWHWRDEPKLLNRSLWPTPCPGGEAALNSCAITRNRLATSADGSFWAFARAPLGAEGRHKAIRIFNAQTGAVVHDFVESHGNDGAMAIAFSPDSKLFVQAVWRGGGTSDELLVYRTDTWAQVQSLLTQPFTPRALAISPDSQKAAVAGARWTPNPHPQIIIVDLKNGTVTKVIDHPFPDGNEVHSLAWSCDGTSLFAGTLVYSAPFRPDAVKIFEPETGTQVRAESADTANVTAMRCSPDSRYLVEAAINGSVRVWDGQHTNLLQTIDVGADPANVFFGISRDSRYLAIAHMDHIAVWEFL